jgi:hypothetical protein
MIGAHELFILHVIHADAINYEIGVTCMCVFRAIIGKLVY